MLLIEREVEGSWDRSVVESWLVGVLVVFLVCWREEISGGRWESVWEIGCAGAMSKSSLNELFTNCACNGCNGCPCADWLWVFMCACG